MERSDSSTSNSPKRSGRPASSVGFAYQARLLERGSNNTGSLSRSGSVSTINSLTTGNSTSSTSSTTRRWTPSHRIGGSIEAVRGKWEERVRAEAVSDEKDSPGILGEPQPPDPKPSHTLSSRFLVSTSIETPSPPSRAHTSPDVLHAPTYLKRHTIPAPIVASPLSPNSTGVTVTNPDPPRVSANASSVDAAYRIRFPPSKSSSINSVLSTAVVVDEPRIDSQSAPMPARSRARTVDEALSKAAGSPATPRQDESPPWRISPSRNDLPNSRRIRPTSVYEDLLTNTAHTDSQQSSFSPRGPYSRPRDLPLSGVGNVLSQVGTIQSSPPPPSAMHPTPYKSSYMSSKKASTYGENLIVGRKLGRHLPRIASGDADDDWVADEDARIQREEDEARNERQKWREQRLERRAAIKHRGTREISSPSTASPDGVAGIPGRLKLSRGTVPSSPSSPPTTRFTRGLWADTQRHLLQAYEYLCHVGEAQQWIEGCLGEELGFGVVDMEESLRNGIALAKLVKVFQGEGVVRRIYEAPKLAFRHSDNINYFFNFVRHVGLPEVCVSLLVSISTLNRD